MSKVDYVSYMTRPGPKLTDRPLIGDAQDEPAGRRPPAPRAPQGASTRPGFLGFAAGGTWLAKADQMTLKSMSGRFIDGPPFGGAIRRSYCIAPLAAGRKLVVISRRASWMRKIATFSGW